MVQAKNMGSHKKESDDKINPDWKHLIIRQTEQDKSRIRETLAYPVLLLENKMEIHHLQLVLVKTMKRMHTYPPRLGFLYLKNNIGSILYVGIISKENKERISLRMEHLQLILVREEMVWILPWSNRGTAQEAKNGKAQKINATIF